MSAGDGEPESLETRAARAVMDLLTLTDDDQWVLDDASPADLARAVIPLVAQAQRSADLDYFTSSGQRTAAVTLALQPLVTDLGGSR